MSKGPKLLPSLCRNCGAEGTINAHLIPQAFIKEVRGGDTAIAMTNSNFSEFQPKQNGRYDDAILCQLCDNKLGNDENFALQSLAKLRRDTVNIVGRPFEVAGLDGDRLLRFALGILWKYTLTRPYNGRIDIGPYADVLRMALFSKEELAPAINAFLIKLHSGDDESYFYCAPIVRKYDGVNYARFFVGGFIFMVKLDQRNPAHPPSEAWLRGNLNIVIMAMPFDSMSEGKMFLSARKTNKRLDAFLDRVKRDVTLQ